MRFYSSIASEATLASGINNSDTSITVDGANGYPANTPFTVVLDPDSSNEEIVDVTDVSGSVWTITRAVDSSLALPHGAGAKVRHMATGRDFQESQDHIEAASGVHGLGGGEGAVVGTSKTQTLTGKTMSGSSNTFSNIPQSAVTNLATNLASINSELDGVGSDLTSHANSTSAHGATGGVVGASKSQTLTNKTINASTNNITVRKQDIDDRYFLVAELNANSSIPADSGFVAPGTMSTLWARGSWSTDGHSSRRVVPKSGLYRVYFRATFAGSEDVTGRPLSVAIYNAPADGSSAGTVLAKKTLGNFNLDTVLDVAAVEHFGTGRVVVCRVNNGYPGSSWTVEGGRGNTVLAVEYLGPST